MTRSANRSKTPQRTVAGTSKRRRGKRPNPPAVSDSPLSQPSLDAVRRYEAIPLLFSAAVSAKRLTGRVVFDSWADGPAIALRDVTEGHVRRLRLKAGKLSLEILAEKHREHWEFVARVYRVRRVAHDCTVRVGGRGHLPSWGGYFHWSSKRVPTKVYVRTYDLECAFETLAWQ